MTDLDAGTWTEIPSLLFTSPHSNAETLSNVSGKNADNRTVFSPATIAGIDWQPDEQLWLRFTVENISGFSQGLAIDDVNFAAIPEPSTWALVLGAAILGLLGFRRFRRGRS